MYLTSQRIINECSPVYVLRRELQRRPWNQVITIPHVVVIFSIRLERVRVPDIREVNGLCAGHDFQVAQCVGSRP